MFGWLYHVAGQAPGGSKNHKERLAGSNVHQQLRALPVPYPVREHAENFNTTMALENHLLHGTNVF